jgi:GT2 family glycosyltransferase
MEAKVAVCVLNYNGEELLKKFIPTLLEHTPPSIGKVYIIDNCSNDNSVQLVQSTWPEIGLVVLGQNFGFTGGYNGGLKSIVAEYFVLINSDVEVTARWLEPMLTLFESTPKIGACQPKVKSYREKGKFEYAGASGGYIDFLGYPFCRGRIFDQIESDQGQYNNAIEVFWATGACMMIRSSLYFESGGLDESFFAHMEEIDLCWRLQRMGYQIYVQPNSVVYHVGGQTLSKDNPRKTYFNFRNSAYMLYKNTTDWSIYWKLPLKMLLDFVAGVKFWKDNSFAHFKAVLLAYNSFFRDYSRIRKTRSALKIKMPLKSQQIYSKSIIWHYFVLGRRYFSDLK